MIKARVFIRTPGGIAGIAGLVVVGAAALLAPHYLTEAATVDDVLLARQGPSAQHWFGTDSLGRDVLARALVATRLSLGMALAAEALSLLLALPVGGAAALLGQRARDAVMRGIDMMIAMPALIVTIYIATVLAPALGLFALAVGIAVPSACRLARLVSTQALSLASRDYVLAARLLGVGRARLVRRYILPNLAESVIIAATIDLAWAILAFSGLSFLGLGVQPPDFDWGRMLVEGVNTIYTIPMAALGPFALICFTTLSFALVGEAMARAANPLLWTAGSRHGTAPAGNLVAEGHARSQASAADAQPASLLSVRDLRVRIHDASGAVEVVKGVSFDLAPGERLGIVGESGSGKSMTAMAIARLLPPGAEASGEVIFKRQDLAALPRRDLAALLGTQLSVVFQDPMSSLNPALTIGRQLTESIEQHQHVGHAEAVSRAVDRLRDVNIPDPERQVARYPHEFSGGMRQRAMIAMGLMTDPQLLICDEPTTALDVTVQAQIMDVLAKLNAERHVAIVLISHNLALVQRNCSRVLVMYGGRIVEELPAAGLVRHARHPYTKALLAAVPDVSRCRTDALVTIPGQPPDPRAPVPGCAFRPRCPSAIARCEAEEPPLLGDAGTRRVACWVAVEDTGSAA